MNLVFQLVFIGILNRLLCETDEVRYIDIYIIRIYRMIGKELACKKTIHRSFIVSWQLCRENTIIIIGIFRMQIGRCEQKDPVDFAICFLLSGVPRLSTATVQLYSHL